MEHERKKEGAGEDEDEDAYRRVRVRRLLLLGRVEQFFSRVHAEGDGF